MYVNLNRSAGLKNERKLQVVVAFFFNNYYRECEAASLNFVLCTYIYLYGGENSEGFSANMYGTLTKEIKRMNLSRTHVSIRITDNNNINCP